jgi:hypothetical protein
MVLETVSDDESGDGFQMDPSVRSQEQEVVFRSQGPRLDIPTTRCAGAVMLTARPLPGSRL